MQGKTIEAVGESFQLNANLINDFYGSVYLSDPRYNTGTDTPFVTAYTISNNIFRHGVSLDIASGPGGGPNGGPTSGRVISGNTFDGDSNSAACPPASSCTADQISKPAVAFDGAGTSVPAFVYPVGPATLSGNTFGSSSENVARRHGTDNSAAFPWANYLANNTFGRATVDTPDGNADNVRSISYGGFPSVERIGGTLQAAHPVGCVGVDCNGEITNAQLGDIVLVAGTVPEQVALSTDLTLRGVNGGGLGGSGSGNGVAISGSGTVTVDRLAVHNYATGINVSGGTVSLTLDTISNNATGVAVSGGTFNASLNAIMSNTVLNMTSTIAATQAHCNWWGTPFGPGATVDANIDYGPYWLVSATLTQANCRPVMSLGATKVSVVEGASGSHTVVNLPVTLSAPWPTGVSAHWRTSDGSAHVADHDYNTGSGTVTFAPNDTTTQTISVTVNGDNKLEDYQLFNVTLSSPVDTGFGLGTEQIEILNDEKPVLSPVQTKTVYEGKNVAFKVNLKQRYYLPITISVTTADGEAVAPGDYTAMSGQTFVIPAGSFGPATVPVATHIDHLVESNEDFSISVSSASTLNTVIGIGTIRANNT